MAGSMIGSVRVTPAEARPGEPVVVEVLGLDGSPLDAAAPVAINGVRGARQVLQFSDPGSFTLAVAARTDAGLEQDEATVAVAAPDWPEIAEPPAGQAVTLPAGLERFPILGATRVQASRSPYHVQLSARDTDHFLGNLARSFEAPAAAGRADPQAVDDALTPVAFAWDFGDGTSAVTASAAVEHDFSASLAPDEEDHLFEVACQLTTRSGSSYEVRRTLSVVNAYAVCRNAGVIAPPVVGGTYATKSMGSFAVNIQVQNLESAALTLGRRRFSYESPAGDEMFSAWEDVAPPVTLAPGAITTVALSVPFTSVPARVHAFGVLFLGDDGAGRAIHLETVLDVALPDHRSSGLRYGRIALTRLAASRFDQVAAVVSALAQQEGPVEVVHGHQHPEIEHPFDPGDVVAQGVEGGNHGIGPLVHGGVEGGVVVQGGIVHAGGLVGALEHGPGHVDIGALEVGVVQAIGGLQVGGVLHHDAEIPVAIGGVEDAAGQFVAGQQVAEGLNVEEGLHAGPLALAFAQATQTLAATEMTAVVAQDMVAGDTPVASQAAFMAAAAAETAVAAPVEQTFATILRDDALGAALLGTADFDPAAVATAVGAGDHLVVASKFSAAATLAHAFAALALSPLEGAACDPDNRPEGIDDQWACQVKVTNGQDEMMTWNRHARFVNARKGDLLVAPGGPAGVIGGLLRQVTPAQRYAHVGVMTRNYDMVTHSTFSSDRLKAHPVGSVSIPFAGSEPAPTEGHDPAILKFGWPGVTTQWILGATDTGRFADLPNMPAPGAAETEVPATDPLGDVYTDVKPFDKYATIGDTFEIIPPLVIKPSPLEETPEVRARLHQLAEAALADTGKSHYRFFCYTDPSIGLTNPEPPGPDWPAGTYPSVCSSFVWVLMSRLGFKMEGTGGTVQATDLEVEDHDREAEVTDGGRDGLYLYHAEERQRAGRWLHGRVHDDVMEALKEKARAKIGGEGLASILADLVNLFSDIADDVANQMCNAFASDWTATEAKDSDAWSHTGDANAVSPDDLFNWDPPSHGGLFGYRVPAAYAPPAQESGPVYVWRFVPNRGTLHGTIRFLGAPAVGAMVQVADGLTAFTRADGSYSLPNVPFGHYELKAQYDRADGGPVPGVLRLEMQQVDQVADMDLAPPRSWYRRLRVHGEFYFMKEYVIGKNPRTDPPIAVDFEVELTPEPHGSSAKRSVSADFHGIFGVASFMFLWQYGGVADLRCTFAVAQDSSILEDAADALSSAVDFISLGYLDTLFGSEVKGGDSVGGQAQPNQPAFEHGFLIGNSGGTQGRFSFRVENVDL